MVAVVVGVVVVSVAVVAVLVCVEVVLLELLDTLRLPMALLPVPGDRKFGGHMQRILHHDGGDCAPTAVAASAPTSAAAY
jgi:hypothetical protein